MGGDRLLGAVGDPAVSAGLAAFVPSGAFVGSARFGVRSLQGRGLGAVGGGADRWSALR